jgi:hypothetical protein
MLPSPLASELIGVHIRKADVCIVLGLLNQNGQHWGILIIVWDSEKIDIQLKSESKDWQEGSAESRSA